jgi:hypothetical protein
MYIYTYIHSYLDTTYAYEITNYIPNTCNHTPYTGEPAAYYICLHVITHPNNIQIHTIFSLNTSIYANAVFVMHIASQKHIYIYVHTHTHTHTHAHI